MNINGGFPIMKKILALTIAVLMILVCFVACDKKGDADSNDSGNAFKEEAELVYEGLYYATNIDGTYEITGVKADGVTEIEIPDEIGGREVTGIANDAFRAVNTLKSVEIPEGILYIGDYAFYGCTALEDVEIPATLEAIGNGAFEGCAVLEELDIADGSALATVGNYAFKDCVKLEFFSFGGAITTVGDGAFINCDTLTTVSIQANVKKLGNGVFAQCENLDEILVANDTLEIGNAAFYTGAETVTVIAKEGSTAAEYAKNFSNYIVFNVAE